MKIWGNSKTRLVGEVQVSGAKNSALRLLAASLLTDQEIVLTNFPASLVDSQTHVAMLRHLGKSCDEAQDDCLTISESASLGNRLDWDGRSIRNTLLILGALTARFGVGAVPLPGGCNLGDRSHDIHVMLLERLGATVWEERGMLLAEAPNTGLIGSEIHLPIRSTGATENAIIASSLAHGTTQVWNPHIRPEILDLVKFLRLMGAKIRVFGQERIEITGVDCLMGAEHRVMPDSMEAITWLVAAVITDGDIEIQDFPFRDLDVVLAHVRAAGARLYQGENSMIVRGGDCYPIEISTGPHPGINSDVQPILAAWAAKARGESRIVDLRFPGRYAYAEEMARMGVQYEVAGDMLKIQGAAGELQGAEVRALDLRAGAALALCGLIAEGETVITDAWQISRGYVGFADKLQSLGAAVQWSD